jgi:hypothetical protein
MENPTGYNAEMCFTLKGSDIKVGDEAFVDYVY